MIAGAPSPRPSTAAGVIALRRATAQDASRVLAWNNAADVRGRSIDPRPIAADQHARWFGDRLRDPRGSMWIALLDGCPVGVVRIDRPAPASLSGPAGRAQRDLDVGRARRPSAGGRTGPAGEADRGPGRISIVLDPSIRGRGLGRRVISLACAADGGPVVAEILADNHASQIAFEAAGFVREPASPAPAALEARPVLRYQWRPRHVHVF